MRMEISIEKFGEYEGKKINAYTIKNQNGFEVTCIDYGCIITNIIAPDREGKLESVVLGFDDIDDYLKYSPFFGAVVGRVAGRIQGSEFELNNQKYTLPANENGNHLHGGNGFDKMVWTGEVIEGRDEASVAFIYTSPDGEEGYPGNVGAKVTYTVNNNNELKITYDATTDQDTLLNLTNHSYFNLSGNLKNNVLNHELTMKSDKVIELDSELLPTGNYLDVANTPFDFQSGRKVEDGITSTHPQNILVGNGYDHPFMLEDNHNQEIVLTEKESGRKLVVETDDPTVVFYTGNSIPTGEFNIRGVESAKYLGLCLETQAPSDSIHHPHFIQCILRKGETYHKQTLYKFGTI